MFYSELSIGIVRLNKGYPEYPGTLHPHRDRDCYQNLFAHAPGQKISPKSVHNFLKYFAHRHTHRERRTDAKKTTSLLRRR